MYQYQCQFWVNGHRTETIVSATSFDAAKRLVEAQYAGAKISWILVKSI